jgi:Flp pilus assembly pilin Flp
MMVQFVRVRLAALLTDRKGISSMEYAALAVGVVGAVLAGAKVFGTALQNYLSALLTTVGL